MISLALIVRVGESCQLQNIKTYTPLGRSAATSKKHLPIPVT